jgi:hypothetical protein
MRGLYSFERISSVVLLAESSLDHLKKKYNLSNESIKAFMVEGHVPKGQQVVEAFLYKPQIDCKVFCLSMVVHYSVGRQSLLACAMKYRCGSTKYDSASTL